MRAVDFRVRQENIHPDLSINIQARLMVLKTLIPMIYPGIRGEFPMHLSRNQQEELQRTILDYNTTLRVISNRQALTAERLAQLPQVIQFFKSFGVEELKV